MTSKILMFMLVLAVGMLWTPVRAAAALTINKTTVNQFEKVELSFTLDHVFNNPYDPDEVSIEATINAPSGKQIKVYGFYDIPYSISFQHYTSGNYTYFNQSGTPSWKVRFTPQEVGQYTGTVKVVSPTYQTGTMVIPNFQANSSINPGFISMSPFGRFLTFSNGSFYYPVGQNISTSYTKGDDVNKNQLMYNGQPVTQEESTYRQIATAGGNSISYLMGSSRNATLRWTNPSNYLFSVYPGYSGLNNINQMSAQQMDNIFDLSANLNIYNNIDILNGQAINQTSTGANGWDQNPYNVVNGGPASSTLDFLTNLEAKRLYKQELRYFVSRWGYSPNLAIIEMLSELDGVFESVANSNGTSYRDQVITATKNWSIEMTAYIRNLDPYHHIISTSEWSGKLYIDGNNQINLIANNILTNGTYDFLGQHIYMVPQTINQSNRNVLGVVSFAETINNSISKPWVFGEWGLDLTNNGTMDRNDTNGIGYHNAQWAAMMRGNSVWPWYVLPNYPGNNLPSLKAVQAFMKPEDFETDFGQLTSGQSKAGVTTNNSSVYVIGMANANKALVWLQNTNSIELRATPIAISGVKLTVNNLSVGNYDVEFWDTWSGNIISQSQIVNSGSLSIDIPGFTRDIAVKIKSSTAILSGDANGDGRVDGLDYVVWLNNYGGTTTQGSTNGDFNADGRVDGLDYVIWLNNYGN